jgi:hypothetical protein
MGIYILHGGYCIWLHVDVVDDGPSIPSEEHIPTVCLHENGSASAMGISTWYVYGMYGYRLQLHETKYSRQ